jgi:hypothetical protein
MKTSLSCDSCLVALVEVDAFCVDELGGSFSVEGCSVVGLAVVGFEPRKAKMGFTVRCDES